jgi:hypothetical protein
MLCKTYYWARTWYLSLIVPIPWYQVKNWMLFNEQVFADEARASCRKAERGTEAVKLDQERDELSDRNSSDNFAWGTGNARRAVKKTRIENH